MDGVLSILSTVFKRLRDEINELSYEDAFNSFYCVRVDGSVTLNETVVSLSILSIVFWTLQSL